MAGHSKWKNIKHKKAASDAVKAKQFTKLLKEITVAAREGGGDLDANPHLRTLIGKANEINMPKDNYTRAIKRGTGELAGVAYESQYYEGYGPYGIAVIVEVLSDNKNRTASDMRGVFQKNGGSLGEIGSVSWIFEKRGIITVTKLPFSEEELIEALGNFAVDDIEYDAEGISTVICLGSELNKVKQALIDGGGTIDDAHLGFHPKSLYTPTAEEKERIIQFLEAIDDMDDVRHLYSNVAW